ncbi:unnamed protein product, partial [Rotaria sp. Silwood1]
STNDGTGWNNNSSYYHGPNVNQYNNNSQQSHMYSSNTGWGPSRR